MVCHRLCLLHRLFDYLEAYAVCIHVYITPTYICFTHGTEAYDTIHSSFHRALAFAHDVELRLNPWYGRPRTGAANGSDPASPAAKNAGVSLTGTTRRGGYEDNGSVKTAGGGSREKRERRREMGMSLATTKKDDLLACG